VDLKAVKAASTHELVTCAIGAAVNAEGLLEDAELLSAAGRHARAYALAALAVEEAGKAVAMTTLAVMPVSLRAQAPLGRMLEWHQLKLVGGLIVTAIPFGSRTVPTQLETMPLGRVEEIPQDAQMLAEDMDRLKQRGLYADIDGSRQARLPSEVTETDVAVLLCRARLAVSAVSVLLAPGAAAQIADPPAEALELCTAVVSAFAEAGSGRTPKAAAEVMLNAVRKLQKQTPASDAWTSSHRERRGTLPAVSYDAGRRSAHASSAGGCCPAEDHFPPSQPTRATARPARRLTASLSSPRVTAGLAVDPMPGR
jgi:AbiV family abortive infection protein